MANIKISALTPVTTVVPGTDVAPLVSGGITTKATPQQIVNAGLLAPGAIGSGTASTGAFTTLSASSTVSGTGFTTYLASPPAIGATAPSTGKFTTIESTIATGTAPFTVASTTNVANLNASSLGGATFASPGAIGSGTASTGAFTTLSASSTVSGTGFSTYLLSPPAIGTTTPAAGKFTNFEYTGTLTGSTGILNIGSNQIYKDASGNVSIGMTTSTWGANFKGLQVAPWTTISGNNNNGGASFACNMYYAGAGGGTTTYVGTGTAAQYLQSNGTHSFNSAASGSANATITFTQVLYVDGSGNLTISGATATKASGTAWANPSDTRLKDNQELYNKGLEELSQIVVKTWEFNGKGGSAKGTKGLGVIANEVELILPESVDTYSAKLNNNDENETDIKRFDASEITWLLVKSVQELAAKVKELEAK